MFNLACGVAALFLLASSPGPRPALATFAVFGGYWANLLAVLVTLVLAAMLAVRAAGGGARPLFARHWLGVFNGACVVFFWSAVVVIGKLN